VSERYGGLRYVDVRRPVFKQGSEGPGPRAANFQGRHNKKIEIEVRYAGKKGCPRERNLREIYTENNVGTTARPRSLVIFAFILYPRDTL
jgi:hypothetical protein